MAQDLCTQSDAVQCEELFGRIGKQSIHAHIIIPLVFQESIGLAENYTGTRILEVDGAQLHSDDNLLVMGLRMRERHKNAELLATLLASAIKGKFWANAHILRTPGHLTRRLRIMFVVVGASLLWCITALMPDRCSLYSMSTPFCTALWQGWCS